MNVDVKEQFILLFKEMLTCSSLLDSPTHTKIEVSSGMHYIYNLA